MGVRTSESPKRSGEEKTKKEVIKRDFDVDEDKLDQNEDW